MSDDPADEATGNINKNQQREMDNVTSYSADALVGDSDKLQQAMAMLSSANAASTAPQQQLAAVNAQDVQVICKDLDVTKVVAERALRESGGDLKAALRQLISQPNYL